MSENEVRLPEAITHGLRRKGTEAVIGVIPNNIAAKPATEAKFLENYEKVPLYTADQMRAMYEAGRREAGRVEGWQPIESAPRDGTYFLAYDANGIGPACVTFWRTFTDGFGKPGEGFVDLESDEFGPYAHETLTHWQPLPAPPLLAALAGEAKP